MNRLWMTLPLLLLLVVSCSEDEPASEPVGHMDAIYPSVTEADMVRDADAVVFVTVLEEESEWFMVPPEWFVHGEPQAAAVELAHDIEHLTEGQYTAEELLDKPDELRTVAQEYGPQLELVFPMTNYQVGIRETIKGEVAEDTTAAVAVMGNSQVTVEPSADLTTGRKYALFLWDMPDSSADFRVMWDAVGAREVTDGIVEAHPTERVSQGETDEQGRSQSEFVDFVLDVEEDNG